MNAAATSHLSLLFLSPALAGTSLWVGLVLLCSGSFPSRLWGLISALMGIPSTEDLFDLRTAWLAFLQQTWTVVPVWCPEWPLPSVSFGIEVSLFYEHFLHRPHLFRGMCHVEWCFSGAPDVKRCRCVCKALLFSCVAFFGGVLCFPPFGTSEVCVSIEALVGEVCALKSQHVPWLHREGLYVTWMWARYTDAGL